MARVWLRVKKVSRDSLVFQLLQLEGKNISSERSNIYMTFYSDRYIRNALRTHVDELRKPTRKDSLFIRNKVKQANRKPELTFAARVPVQLKSKSPLIKVEKVKVSKDFLTGQGLSDEYLYPEFNIMIKPAYKDFNYSFTVMVM